jgi:hypothetical protein
MARRELPEPTGELANRLTANGKRRLQLNQKEKDELKEKELISSLVVEMLNLDENKTYEEMAEKLDITVPTLKNLTRTKEFEEQWNEHYMQLGKDPRIQLVQSKITELLPMVFVQMREGLIDPDVPWTARWKIMEKVLDLSGIEKPQLQQNDRKEIQSFLKAHSESEDSIQITIPSKYMDAMQKYRDGERDEEMQGENTEENVIEGEYNDMED